MKTINAKGNSPQLEAAVRKAVERGEAELDVLLDNPVYASGVMRFLESKGFGVQLRDDEGTITISAHKGGEPLSGKPPLGKQQSAQPSLARPANAPNASAPAGPVYETRTIARPRIPAPRQELASEPASAGTCSVLITRSLLGGDPELGETLMKNFLSALTQMERPPLAVALMNDGVKLALYDSSSCDHLKSLEKKGASILVCGTCANYFNIMDEIGAGSISGMLEIVETVSRAGKVITI